MSMLSVSQRFSTLRASFLASILPLILITLAPQKASAVTITATASGSPTPPIINGNSLQNGDFLITPNVFTTLGDGIDEFVNWDFDFSSDPNLSLFLNSITSHPLDSALLTLTLSPRSGLITTDSTGIPGSGIPSIRIPSVPGLPSVGSTGTISFDLLNPPAGTNSSFTSANILSAFNSPSANSIEWSYQDDAIVSFAQLELTVEDKESVPEHTSLISIFVLGIFGVGSFLKNNCEPTKI